MNYLRKYRNRHITKVELVSALGNNSFLISPPDGFTDEDIPTGYNGVYFTISTINLSQTSKIIAAGTFYTITLEFNFPNFSGADEFQKKFGKLSEIRLTVSTGAVIRLNKNDISLNKPIDVIFQNNLKTVGFSAQLSQLFPLKLDEQ